MEDLKRDIKDAQQKMKLFKLDPSIHYVYYLGITGSGKSTSINYFLSENVLQHSKKAGKFTILSSNQKHPKIGHTNISCTVIPELFQDNNPNVVHVDPPGFLDTNGPNQETINSYSNAKMFQRGTQTKIVIVIEHGTLQSGKGSNFP